MRQWIVVIVFIAALATTARAQGTKADYDRAAHLGELTRGKVLNASVDVHWSADGNSLWFREALPGGGGKFWFVDATTGVKRPAVDADRAVAGNGSTIRLSDGPVRSGDNGEQTTVTITNKTAGPIHIKWVDSDGNRHDYGTVQPGQSSDQNTYVNHAWIVTDDADHRLAAFVTPAGGGTVLVDGKTTATPPSTRPARRTRSTANNSAESPDGKWTVLHRNDNLILQDRKTRAESPLTTDGSAGDGYSDVFWSPDSTHVVSLKTRQGEHHVVHIVQSSPPDQLQPKLISYDYLKPGDRIPITKPHLFVVDGKKEISLKDDLFPNPWELDDVRWAPDSKRFTFQYNQRGHQVLRILSADAATGVVTPIIDEQSKTFIDYAGKHFVEYLDKSHEIIWMSERSGWNHLYLFDDTGRVKNPITSGEWVLRKVDRVDAEKRQVWFEAGGVVPGQDPYYVHFCRIDFDGSHLIDLTPGDGNHTVRYSPDGRFLVDTYSRVDMPPVTELRFIDGKLICELARADATELLKAGWKYPEHFVAKARDGVTDIYGVIYRPTNFDPAKKYPVIEDIYAGPQGSFVPKSFVRGTGGMTMAELGFIVVQIDGMGTSNRSRAFHDVCWRNLGDAGFPDRILWMQAAAKVHPEMDLTRVGVYGTSAGGQDALRAVEAFGDFYKAAVADCGCHDNRMDKIWWNELWMGWPIGPWYAEQSNVTNAKNLHGALLLIVGETDHNVDPASTMQVVNALIKADKDFELLVIPNADHGQDGRTATGDVRTFSCGTCWASNRGRGSLSVFHAPLARRGVMATEEAALACSPK